MPLKLLAVFLLVSFCLLLPHSLLTYPVEFLYTEVDLGSNNGNLKQGEIITVTYRLKNLGSIPFKGNVAGSISFLGEKVVHRYQQNIEIKGKQSIEISFQYAPTEPGMYFLYLKVKNNVGSLKDNSHLIGYALEEIKSPLTRKVDFEEFWQNNLSELAKINPQFKITKRNDLSSPTYIVYAVEMQSVDNEKIRAWYRVPINKTKVPVVLQIPSLGGAFYNIRSLTENPKYGVPYDFAVLSLNIRGHGNSKGKINVGENAHQLISYGLTEKESYFYRGAILDCIRAVDFLHTRSEIDSKKIVVDGASQGGALALITSALDDRIKLCTPDVPFLSDIDQLTKIARWVSDELNRYVKTQKNTSYWRLIQNLSYFDTKNFADKIKAPVYMSVGLQDWTCPASTCLATYNKITTTKQCIIYPEGKHDGGGAWHRIRKFEWIRKQLEL
jgi:cephalosporin-C deacetylase-like acetyl esterase